MFGYIYIKVSWTKTLSVKINFTIKKLQFLASSRINSRGRINSGGRINSNVKEPNKSKSIQQSKINSGGSRIEAKLILAN
jgi:hypothetical protein